MGLLFRFSIQLRPWVCERCLVWHRRASCDRGPYSPPLGAWAWGCRVGGDGEAVEPGGGSEADPKRAAPLKR